VTTPDDDDASAAAAPLPESERTIAFGAYGGGSHEPATHSSAPAQPAPPLVAPAHETTAAPTSLPPMLHPEPAPDTHVFTIKPYVGTRLFPWFEASFIIYILVLICIFTNWKLRVLVFTFLVLNFVWGYLVARNCIMGVTASEFFWDNPFGHRFSWKLEYIEDITHTTWRGAYSPIVPDQLINLKLTGQGRHIKPISCRYYRSFDIERTVSIVKAAQEKRPGWWK
jgi:hypothetical protein